MLSASHERFAGGITVRVRFLYGPLRRLSGLNQPFQGLGTTECFHPAARSRPMGPASCSFRRSFADRVAMHGLRATTERQRRTYPRSDDVSSTIRFGGKGRQGGALIFFKKIYFLKGSLASHSTLAPAVRPGRQSPGPQQCGPAPPLKIYKHLYKYLAGPAAGP